MGWNLFKKKEAPNPGQTMGNLAQGVVERSSPEELRRFLEKPSDNLMRMMMTLNTQIMDVLESEFGPVEKGLSITLTMHADMAILNDDQLKAAVEAMRQACEDHRFDPSTDVQFAECLARITQVHCRARNLAAKVNVLLGEASLPQEKRILLLQKYTMKRIAELYFILNGREF